MNSVNFILADGRWSGPHGIGRFSKEVLARLENTDIMTQGPKPLSLANLVWLPYQLRKQKSQHAVFFTPGFNPVLGSSLPVVFTIHDLIHLSYPGKNKWAKEIFYNLVIKPAARQAYKILTVSEYSKKTILEWSNLPSDKVVVVGNGISDNFTQSNSRHQPGYPYLLHTGNTTKEHKNIARLLQAFLHAKINPEIRLIFTGTLSDESTQFIEKNNLQKRVIFAGTLTELQLADYYRGSIGVVFPSLYEGFGLPVLEALACGTPVLTSNITSLPEVAGNAAIFIDPFNIDDITQGIEKLVTDEALRASLIEKGLERAKLFSWDKTVEKIQCVLNEASKR